MHGVAARRYTAHEVLVMPSAPHSSTNTVGRSFSEWETLASEIDER
jgi:hypothetical protein